MQSTVYTLEAELDVCSCVSGFSNLTLSASSFINMPNVFVNLDSFEYIRTCMSHISDQANIMHERLNMAFRDLNLLAERVKKWLEPIIELLERTREQFSTFVLSNYSKSRITLDDCYDKINSFSKENVVCFKEIDEKIGHLNDKCDQVVARQGEVCVQISDLKNDVGAQFVALKKDNVALHNRDKKIDHITNLVYSIIVAAVIKLVEYWVM